MRPCYACNSFCGCVGLKLKFKIHENFFTFNFLILCMLLLRILTEIIASIIVIIMLHGILNLN